MRKAIFYIGIAGVLIGVTMLIIGYQRLDNRDDAIYLLGYGSLILIVSGIVTFIAKIFIDQRG